MIRVEDRKLPLSPSPEDVRDYKADMMLYGVDVLPVEYVSPKPTIKDQGTSSMCVAFAISSLKEIQEMRERGTRQLFSPAYIYGIRDGWFEGEGMYVKDALKDLRRYGICKFEDFPMIDSFDAIKQALNPKLSQLAPYATNNAVQSFVKLLTTEEIKRAIVADGGVIVGLQVYPSFYYPVNGIIPQKQDGEVAQGGHGILAFGWKFINGVEHWICANSWGESWGDRGLFYIPVGYKPIYEVWSATDAPLKLNEKTKLIMYIGDKNLRIIKNDVPTNIQMDVAPFILDGRTCVPVSYLATMLNADVKWIPEWKCITIESK